MKNSKGLSLIELLIAVAILGAMSFGFASMMVNQNKSVQGLSEQLAKLDLEKLLIASLADGKICTAVLNSKTFDPVSLNWSPALSLNSLPASEAPGAPNLIETNSQIANGSSLTIENISFVNLINNGVDASSTSYRVTLQVSFANGSRPHKPIRIQANLTTDSNTTLKTVSSCLSSTGAQENSFGGTWQNMTALRANGATYTNDTGSIIMFAATGNCCGNSNTNVWIDNREVYRHSAQWNGGSGYGSTGMWIVPPGSTYRVIFVNGIRSWWEFR